MTEAMNTKQFWMNAVQVAWDCEPIYDVCYKNGLPSIDGRVAEIEFDLACTDELVSILDEIRARKGYKMLLNNETDGWYNFYIVVEDVDGGRLETDYISATTNNTEEDDGHYYEIYLSEEAQKWVYEALDLSVKQNRRLEFDSIGEYLKDAREKLNTEKGE